MQVARIEAQDGLLVEPEALFTRLDLFHRNLRALHAELEAEVDHHLGVLKKML